MDAQAETLAIEGLLSRQGEMAWNLARHEQGQRDEYTSKLRFGATAFNAASLVSVLNLPQTMTGFTTDSALIAAGFFVVGTICGAASLLSHQNFLIGSTGRFTSYAMTNDRAISLSRSLPGTSEHSQLGEALEELEKAAKDGLFKPNDTAVTAQSFSMWAWLGGVLAAAISHLWAYFSG
jgi:hypothetical protein